MSRWVRSNRYANRMVRVGRLMVVFRGELAEVPDWAEREYRWMLARMPGVVAAESPHAPSPAASPTAPPPPEVASEAAPAPSATEEVAAAVEPEAREPASRGRAGRRGR